ncbi:hypothetical protein [Legionella fairfieldensis]|uniref:hypothetical protein n=1 Tax=Legionella fairfieldensis TaxID=45064 RepID=UPI00048D8BC8|nr:hypothetical protein [Legionella fairfieldensis]
MTAPTGSIGGKTAAVTDTVPGQTSLSIATPDWGGFGTDIGSALYETSAQGANNGSSNSATIVSTLTPPTSLSDYAAGLCSTLSVDDTGASSCTTPSVCYTNWYLPAICELGPYGVICTSGSTNIQQQLFENTLIPSTTLGLVDAGYYWSSTELSGLPQGIAWYEYFSTSSSTRSGVSKNSLLGVRCSRKLISLCPAE